ncbi:hypothetical protein GCM10010272_11380 [Streptomyces lateritius]|nr:hypothetical protein GCM10010272_11380 [Streptomyces lateritius]
MVKEAKSPIAGSTPAMIEKEIASGISARATTRPASTSVRSTFGESVLDSADRTDREGGNTATDLGFDRENTQEGPDPQCGSGP